MSKDGYAVILDYPAKKALEDTSEYHSDLNDIYYLIVNKIKKKANRGFSYCHFYNIETKYWDTIAAVLKTAGYRVEINYNQGIFTVYWN